MTMTEKLFTSESVTEGHPDKVCDQISDAILDAHLAEDPSSRCAVECLVTGNTLVIAGEVSSAAQVDIEQVARETIRDIGYTDPSLGFSDRCEIVNHVHAQAVELARNASLERPGAGDQGLMFGYACDHTEDYMPLPIHLAHRLTQRLAHLRKTLLLEKDVRFT